MRARPARSPWRMPAPGRQRPAAHRGLVLLALALLTTLGAVPAVQTALESRGPESAVVTDVTQVRLSLTGPAAPAVTWRTRPASPTDVGTALRHLTKVKRAAARTGHRGARGLTILLLAALVALLGAFTANSACDRPGCGPARWARTGIGHPRRGPPPQPA